PIIFAVFTTESLLSFDTYGDKNLLILSEFAVFGLLTSLLIMSNDYETQQRSNFIRSRNIMSVNTKLMARIWDLSEVCTRSTVDLESPLEKTLGILSRMRLAPNLNREQVESLGVALTLLNSDNLMAPNIEEQMLDSNLFGEEGE
ncbi:hypothetical protein HK405_011906, partial [Cladochytrium tenue]